MDLVLAIAAPAMVVLLAIGITALYLWGVDNDE